MELISREEIKTLIEQPKGNCVSIYMPTHPAGPEVRQNPIRFNKFIDRVFFMPLCLLLMSCCC